jgi:hypothetical protein
LYEAKDTKASLVYLKIADAYKDSIFGAGNIEAMQTLVAREENVKRRIETDKIAYQKSTKSIRINSWPRDLADGCFFIFIRNNRKEKRTRKGCCRIKMK